MSSTACPFPDCQERDAARVVAGGVYCCAKCRRMTQVCGMPRCQALNRPMARHCRSCGQETHTTRGITSQRLWRDAERLNHDATLRTQPAPEVVCELSNLEEHHGRAASGIELEMSICEGLLAVHHAGQYLALMHMFGSDPQAILWSHAEEASDDARRPYPPVSIAPGRFVVFSSPQGATAIDVWSLRGWSMAPDPRCQTIWSSRASGYRLAAQAVPLGEDRVGLLLMKGDRYFWSVVHLNASTAIEEVSQQSLEFTGTPCQWRLTDPGVLLWMTPRGQWAWKLADAVRGETAGLLRTWPQDMAEGALLLDRQLEEPRLFGWARQAIDFSRGLEGASDTLVCYYQRRAEQGPAAEYYGLDLRRWQSKAPQALHGGQGAVPVGVRLTEEGVQQMTFLRGRDLFYDSSGGLSPLQIMTPGTESISGLKFQDPLLVTTVMGNPWSIDLLSLRRPHLPVRIRDVPLLTDPLVWSRWMFTCEGDGAECRILRREIADDDAENIESSSQKAAL